MEAPLILGLPSLDPIADYQKARDRYKELEDLRAGARAAGHHARATRYDAEARLVWLPRMKDAEAQIHPRELRGPYHLRRLKNAARTQGGTRQ